MKTEGEKVKVVAQREVEKIKELVEAKVNVVESCLRNSRQPLWSISGREQPVYVIIRLKIEKTKSRAGRI